MIVRQRELNLDRSEGPHLMHHEHAQARHLEQREKRHHQVGARDSLFEEGVKRDDALALEPIGELEDPLGDRDPVNIDGVFGGLLNAREELLESVEQLENAVLHQRRRTIGLGRRSAAREDIPTENRRRAELLGRLTVLLIFEQPADELRAGVEFFGRIVVLAGGRRRQEHLALDVRERRRHHEVLARDVDVQFLHEHDVLNVLLAQKSDRDVEDVELVLLDQVQQQVERSLKGRELDVIDAGRWGRCPLAPRLLGPLGLLGRRFGDNGLSAHP